MLEIELRDIESKISAARDLITNREALKGPLRETKSWLQLCSSLDALGDTTLGIQAYLAGVKRVPANDQAENYLRLYGALQCLFVQQDAVKHLYECLGKEIELDHPALQTVRRVRNISTGHPTKRGTNTYGFINRSMLTDDTFHIETARPGGSTSESHLVPELIRLQLTVVSSLIQEFVHDLRDNCQG